ncbi:serine hydrolase domain-containing protein [Bradyrhizobium sp. CCBAU 11361]|uniref:serine hydrolase domain-containing protein n=1 Tax=Bradyrhizobium sp. CCBAU 11361 TaxID=1630812 RepID=UPI0023045FF9|nr:serine hydrolase domain-containing protein [Bradyrhizobium sp. CCBAU 11361]
MREIISEANPDLYVGADHKARWERADHRRHGFHNLHRLARYGISYRSARVMLLQKAADLRIANMETVGRLTSLPWFSAMAVIRGDQILYEKYAQDFNPDHPHSIKSISKTVINLLIGRLVEDNKIQLGKQVCEYLPWIGSGYHQATVQQVLNMDVANSYSEDCTDPLSTAFDHEEALGWRLPVDLKTEKTQRAFLASITSRDIKNRTGYCDYKSANSDVLGMIAESVTGKPLRVLLADVADAAGFEGCLHITTDREGFPAVCGGMCLTARDLARYGSIFMRRGMGIDGLHIGSGPFIDASLQGGTAAAPPREGLRYCNHTFTDGRWIGHGGAGGQFMLVDLVSGVVAVFLSVLEVRDSSDRSYTNPIIQMLSQIGRLEFAN